MGIMTGGLLHQRILYITLKDTYYPHLVEYLQKIEFAILIV